MKVAILVLAFVALTASVAYAAPTENKDAEIEAFLNKLMEQEEASEQDNRAAQIESLLAQLQDEDSESEEAALQEFFAREQVPAQLQNWFKKAFRKVGGFVKKHALPALRFAAKHVVPIAVKAIGRR